MPDQDQELTTEQQEVIADAIAYKTLDVWETGFEICVGDWHRGVAIASHWRREEAIGLALAYCDFDPAIELVTCL